MKKLILVSLLFSSVAANATEYNWKQVKCLKSVSQTQCYRVFNSDERYYTCTLNFEVRNKKNVVEVGVMSSRVDSQFGKAIGTPGIAKDQFLYLFFADLASMVKGARDGIRQDIAYLNTIDKCSDFSGMPKSNP